MDTYGAESKASHDGIDPEWEGDSIREDAPEVENGGIPEMIHLLEWEMPSTLRNAKYDGMIFPEGKPNFLDLAQMSLSLLSELEETQRGGRTAPPVSLDGANSMRPRSDSEPVSEESSANKFPDEQPFIGINRRDSRIAIPEPSLGPSDDTTGSDSSVLLSIEDDRRHRPWVKVKHKQDDEITPAPPLWDEVDTGIPQPPAKAGAGPGAFNPDPRARNTRTIRQRIASARQTLREIVQEDREWIRGAMVRIGIRSEHDPGENERPAARRPERAAGEKSRRERSSRGAGIKARVTPYLSLRGGSGTPSESDEDVPPLELSPRRSARTREQSQAGSSRPREQSQNNTPSRGQSQDNTPPSEQPQDNTRPRGQSQVSTPPTVQPQANTRPRGERHSSGSSIPERPLLSPSRQFRHSFRSPRTDARHNPEYFDSPRSDAQHNPEHSSQSPHSEARHNSEQSFQGPHSNARRYSIHLPQSPHSNARHNSEPEIPGPRPFLPRPQHFGHSLHRHQAAVDQPQRVRPSEYTHPLARLTAFQNEQQNSQRDLAADAAARGTLDGSPHERPPSRLGHRQHGRHGSNPSINARNEDVSPRPPSYNTWDDRADQNVGQNIGQDAGQDVSQPQNQSGNQNDAQNAGQNTSGEIHRRIPSPLLERYHNEHAPLERRRRDRAMDRLSTLSKQTGKKIKKKMSRFATLGRRSRAPEVDPVGGVLEPFTPESETAPTPPAATATLPPVVPATTDDPEPSVSVHEEAYTSNSLRQRRRLNMWPFNRKRGYMTTDF